MKEAELPKFKFKRDQYMRSRGTPQMLYICCSSCNTYLMCYQKDGPGPLKRCYIDRIFHPEYLEKIHKEPFSKNDCPHLICTHCHTEIGYPIIYEKENRPAFHLKVGSVSIKKIPAQKRIIK